jgi:glycerol-3-phosphate dehydrogenase (NAD(P)+)
MKISVFGSGGWGTAVAKVLCENGHAVTLWSKFENEVQTLRERGENPLLPGVAIPAEITLTSDADAALQDISMAVIATPSFAVAQTAQLIKDKLPKDCIVVCVSKGIEQNTTRLFSRILRDTLGEDIQLASVSGPTHAEEVGLRIPTACVAASEDITVAEAVQDAFMNDYLRVYTSTDVVGVELGAALKNVIALGAGISDGLGFGDNTIAMLMTRGLAEMAELCVKLGGKKSTLAGLAGLGDLIVTCTSKHSRNRRAGVLIGKGVEVQQAMKEVGAVVEGYYAAKAARDLSEKTGVNMPICTEAYKILYEGKSPREAMRDLMSRARRNEDSGEENWVG